MKKIILTLIILLPIFCTTIDAQSRKKIAQQQIQDLKKGVLLVRLKNPENRVEILNERHYYNKARTIELLEKGENRLVFQAIKKHFNFCQIYYFFSNNATAVKNGNYTHVFDEAGDSVSIDLQTNIFFAAYTHVYLDTEFNVSDRLISFVIMDNNFKQLQKPFPYYASFTTSTYIPNKVEIFKSLSSVIEKNVYLLNLKLETYYKRIMRPINKKKQRQERK